MGYSTDEIIKLFRYFSKDVIGLSPRSIFTEMKEIRGIKLGGITSSYGLESAIKEAAKLKGINNIQDIKMPISIPATDLIQDKEIIYTNYNKNRGEQYIKDIEIGKAVRASSSFPGMYTPFEYKKYQFVDGGIFDNLPITETKKLDCDKVIAVKFNCKTPRKQNAAYNIAMHSLDLMTENIIKQTIQESDYVINVDVKDTKPFSIGKIDFCYKEGYMQTVDQIVKIKKCLKS